MASRHRVLPAPSGNGATSSPVLAPQPGHCYSLESVAVEFASSRGPREVLRSVSFEVGEGEIVGIVGRSGTGKTTLLRVMGGLLPPTSGRVLLEGQRVVGPPPTVVTVFQDYVHALLPWRTVGRNVALPLERTLAKGERAERVASALELVGLTGRDKDYPWQLSGGMQQRVQIARALAVQPKVLLMDEPFGALDAMTKATLQDELMRVQEQTRATIVFITHDLEEAIYLSDRVLVISGTPGEITHNLINTLPRPRHQLTSRELPEFLDIRHRLGQAIWQ